MQKNNNLLKTQYYEVFIFVRGVPHAPMAL